MKKYLLVLIIIVLGFSLVACNTSTDTGGEKAEKQELVTIKVGATAIPHAEILEEIKPLLQAEGIKLEIVEYQDYVLPNTDLAEKQIDANYFQHIPYLESFISDRGLNLTYITKVHIEPMGVYSNKIEKLTDLKEKAIIAIPNDPTNGGRALALLEEAGILKLADGVGISATVQDIVDNPKKLVIKELDAAMLPRALADVELAVINTNYALEADLNPVEDALIIESADSPYANVLAVRTEDKEDANLKKLADILTSKEVKAFIEEKYKGAVVPAF